MTTKKPDEKKPATDPRIDELEDRLVRLERAMAIGGVNARNMFKK